MADVRLPRDAQRLANVAQLVPANTTPAYCTGRAYTVLIGAHVFGVVYRSTRDSSRKAGRLIVRARRTPCWSAEPSRVLRHRGSSQPVRCLDRDTRREAIVELFDSWLVSSTNLEDA